MAKHSLSKIDEEALTGVCAVCGPIEIYRMWYKKYNKYKYACKIRQTVSNHNSRNTDYAAITEKDLRTKWETLEAQVACQICGASFAEERACIDHDHKTGVIRGKLCMLCNTGLGKFRDDPVLLQKAIDYLMLQSS